MTNDSDIDNDNENDIGNENKNDTESDIWNENDADNDKDKYNDKVTDADNDISGPMSGSSLVTKSASLFFLPKTPLKASVNMVA